MSSLKQSLKRSGKSKETMPMLEMSSTLPFAELFNSSPLQQLGTIAPEATYATVHYCIEADEMPEGHVAIEVFKDVAAKLVEVPVADVMLAMMSIEEIADDFENFTSYHEWYIAHNDTPEYPAKNRWPCIAASYADEVLQDGSHRMHSYIRAGHETIPILLYDAEAWWKAHASWSQSIAPDAAQMRRRPRG